MVRIEEQRLWKKTNKEIEDSDENNGDGEEEEEEEEWMNETFGEDPIPTRFNFRGRPSFCNS